MNRNRKKASIRLLLAAFALSTSATIAADVTGRITTAGDGRQITGVIRWKAVARKYTIVQQGPGNIELEIDPAKVAKIEVVQPKELQPAIEAFKAGRFAQVIPVLDKLAQDYLMLQWDEPATRYLAEAYLATDDPANAVKACERVTGYRPEAAYMSEMAVAYWTALLKTNRSARLEEFLELAAKSGNRPTAARALILRGDMLRERKQPRDALKDGYLRVVVLYKNVREVQPEALFKAMKAFEELQQIPHAERMRTALRTDFPTSEYTRKL